MIRLLKKKNRGFTLIELMIVIAIIAILAAILVPNFIRARAQSQLAACGSNMKNIATAEELYATDNNGAYTATTATLLAPVAYIRTMPNCPSGPGTYIYSVAVAPSANFTLSHTAASHTGLAGGAASPVYSASGGLVTQ